MQRADADVNPCLTPEELAELAGPDAPTSAGRYAEHLRACTACGPALDRARAVASGVPVEPGQNRRRGDRRRSANPLVASDEIEGYQIQGELHRGGQGVVYKAIQTATNRTVALKVLREGPFASDEQRYRFQREVDLAAKLNHPAIVTIFDSGISRGRPYFVMEYIDGHPFDDYVSGHQLGVHDTLVLFRKVCAGIHHAHLRGVIHRDLKPGNILVDAQGEPHVLDFGMAKLTGDFVVPQGAPVTMTGEFVGTLGYCSPEQARGETDLVDIRSDVYSLGVILYQALTGNYPYSVTGSVAEVLQNVASAEPKKPSAVRRELRDDVDTIVLEALAKERERRYQSVEDLSQDIENYLAGRPIDARRDSTLYVLDKTLRRYRMLVAAVLVVAAIITTFSFILARQAGHLAAERDRAEQARARSERDAERAEMAATAWYTAWVRDESPVPVLRRALELNRIALGEDDPDLALHVYNLAASLEAEAKGDPAREAEVTAEVEALLREAVALLRRTLPPGDPRLLESIELLGRKTRDPAERRALQDEALRLRRLNLPPDDPSLITNLEALAAASVASNPAAAEKHLREALDVRRLCLPVDAAGASGAMERLAELTRARGDLSAALALQQEALELRRREMPEDREGLASALLRTGELLVATGAASEAEPVLREALDLLRGTLPPFDVRVAVAMSALAEALVSTGQLEEAQGLLSVSLPTLQETLGATDARTVRAVRTLAALHEANAQPEEAARHRALLPPE